MSRQSRQRHPDQHSDNGQDAAPEQAERVQRAWDESDNADDLLDDIDRALKAACGFDEDEVVTPEELAVRAAAVVDEFRNKGGQ
jgi:hypothetical protein